MPEFFTVLTPADALAKLWAALPPATAVETVPLALALGRVTAQAIVSPENLPAFPRSTMDGYAVRAQDTFGASQTLPAYLKLAGEVPMGQAPTLTLQAGEVALVHTGGMLPAGADAVVMVEVTQKARADEIEVLKAVAPGENILQVGDDVSQGQELLPPGHVLRPQDVGGLAALGLTQVVVARRPRVALLATGDEVVPPDHAPHPGQVRDVNTSAIASLVQQAGGIPIPCGIAPDNFDALYQMAQTALAQADVLVLSAGSSVSVRDMTAEVAQRLGPPGVLVHGVAVKPGKPTILGVSAGKPVFGLPGNPVSALVIADLFLLPTLYRLQGCPTPPVPQTTRARLTHNLASQTGRVDYVPVRLREENGETWAEPLFGKSNQIFTLVFADGMVTIPIDANGVSAGEEVRVRLF